MATPEVNAGPDTNPYGSPHIVRGFASNVASRYQFSGGAGAMSNESDELKRLRAENARLIILLESHQIDWRHDMAPNTPSAPPTGPSSLSTAEKVTLFRRLFRGRTDVHPVRWESATTGRSGYAPACANKWRTSICEKPRVTSSCFPNTNKSRTACGQSQSLTQSVFSHQALRQFACCLQQKAVTPNRPIERGPRC